MSEIVNGNPIDKNQSRKANPKVTKFEWTKHLLGTYRFGEYGIALAFNGLAGDKVKIRQGSSVDSYSLKSPLLTPISMNKTYFQIPKMAILPRAWNKIYENPSYGEDIDASLYGTSLPATNFNALQEKLNGTLMLAIQNFAEEADVESILETGLNNLKEYLEEIIKYLYITELLYSEGNLLSALGAHIGRLFKWKENKTYDDFLEELINSLFKEIQHIKVTNTRTNKQYIVSTPSAKTKFEEPRITHINWHQFQEELRDGENFKINTLYSSEDYAILPGEDTSAIFHDFLTENEEEYYNCSYEEYTKPLDLARVWAYQLACAEFFTNDKVDYVYNAEVFRQYVGGLCNDIIETIPTYILNGITMEVDYLSAYMLVILTEDYDIDDIRFQAYLYAMLKYNRSLKYKDYFTGARTRPIAIGNTQIDVNDDVVEVIDIASNIQKQRFLNVVNKIPRDLKGYTKGIMGVDVAPDWHNPLYLARVTTTIFGQEVENTGEAQLTEEQSRTSVLKGGGNIEINFKLDRDSIIIGIIDFDIPRAYTMGVHRSFMEVDRFDFFNPYMQYTGDQEIYGQELDARQADKFGYTEAYMEKKQDYNEAFGGFITSLKGWTFLDRFVEGERNNYREKKVIGPDFIRSKPSELDRFYISLTGNSLANYFHFIIDHTTFVSAIRKMAYKPQILG